MTRNECARVDEASRRRRLRVIFLWVVEAGGAGVGVAGEALHFIERDALGEQVGDDGDPERVRRE